MSSSLEGLSPLSTLVCCPSWPLFQSIWKQSSGAHVLGEDCARLTSRVCKAPVPPSWGNSEKEWMGGRKIGVGVRGKEEPGVSSPTLTSAVVSRSSLLPGTAPCGGETKD